MKFTKKIILWVGTLFILSELVIRLTGIGDFPIYQTDREIGYIPAPSQSGKFLHQNEWVYNKLSMGVAEEFPTDHSPQLLLMGDSIVQGGNPYRQNEKLGPQLQTLLEGQWKVWPVGAPSWGFLNQQEYLRRYPEVLRSIQGIIWIFNSGDFQDRSQWWSDATHPRQKPLFMSYYALNKYLLEKKFKFQFPELLFWVKGLQPPSSLPIDAKWEDWENQFMHLQTLALKSKVIVFYPDLQEFVNPGDDHYQNFIQRMQGLIQEQGWILIDLRQRSDWKKEYYRDWIHPTPEGNRVLSEIIAENF